MKASLAIAIIVLVALLGLGWHDHRELARLRESQAGLVAQATAQGITIDPRDPGKVSLPAKLPREDRAAEAKQIAGELMAFADDMEGLERDAELDALDELTRGKIISHMDRAVALDAEQLEILITEVRAASGGSEQYRDLICYALYRLAKVRPETALGILMESPGLFEMVHHGGLRAENLVGEAVRWLAPRDPGAVRRWLNENRASLPASVTDMASKELISAVGVREPRLALSMIDEFGKNPADFLPIILPRSTPQERTTSLGLLREWSAAMADTETGREAFEAALKALAFSDEYGPKQGRAGFDESTSWIAQAKLSPAELEIIADNLQNSTYPKDAGRWVEWMERNLSVEITCDWTGSVFENWLLEDPKAAERWLEAKSDGPVQERAVTTYVETMLRVDPQAAVRWALKLPEGKGRAYLLDEIYSEWPRRDEASTLAAEAFAQEHGLKK